MKARIAITITAATLLSVLLFSCKNNGSGTDGNPAAQDSEGKLAEAAMESPEGKAESQDPGTQGNIDVVYLAGLYCKVTDMDKARIFLGKETNNLFAVKKDVENNYASVYAQTQYENSLNFYMWTDKDGTKVLGVNLVEIGEKGRNKKSLQFFTYDAKLNMAVPCKRLNEIVTNKIMSIRHSISSFVFRIPTSPEDENITLGYWEKKDKDKYHEIVFEWDGHTFNIR